MGSSIVSMKMTGPYIEYGTEPLPRRGRFAAHKTKKEKHKLRATALIAKENRNDKKAWKKQAAKDNKLRRLEKIENNNPFLDKMRHRHPSQDAAAATEDVSLALTKVVSDDDNTLSMFKDLSIEELGKESDTADHPVAAEEATAAVATAAEEASATTSLPKGSQQSRNQSYPLVNGCDDNWTWNHLAKSHEVRLSGPKGRIAHFHPNWSNGTAGVRGTRVLNHGRYYWELNISERVFGTSMMFGIGTEKARLHVD